MPLQVPSAPQVEAADIVHWVAGVGVWPAGTGEQVPALLVSAQDMQVPVQALLQQTPCAQKPDWQAAAAEQGAPGGSFPQLPLVQELGATQSLLVVQVILQAPVPHWKGSHSVEVTVLQFPVPSQVRAGVSVSPLQLCATQVVPLV